ncbi:hypothetical protein [Hoeflea poritis]|uniref:NAD(P)-binding domain-containing protein n=1 Tax=Hoeflea poritis TaxID=2993659 RepID=A0ABT4VV56_9HYPH|nr:hypothetical protein [Hoeflea poritis]MDA4848581.1 hypothetical protein [Hoeflea poritis]
MANHILVTGGTGKTGRRVADQLRAKGLDWGADLLTGFAHEHETPTDVQDRAQTTADMIDSPQQPITPNDSSKGVPQ